MDFARSYSKSLLYDVSLLCLESLNPHLLMSGAPVMKSILAFASVVAFSVAPAFAGEGQVSNPSLAKMGLSGMKAMSDAQGMNVRGLSVAVVGGFSQASIHSGGGEASSTNFYFAAGKHSASGANLSGAAALNVSGYHTSLTVVAAGGFSTASAH